MKNRKLLIVLAIAFAIVILALTFCKSEQHIEQSDNQRIKTGNPGTDSEEIRPEIKQWIEDNYKSAPPRQKAALLKLARAYHYLLAHPEDTNDIYYRITPAVSCYNLAFGFNETAEVIARDMLAAQIFDTIERSQKRINWYNNMAGQVTKPVSFDKWEGNCDTP